MLSRARSSVRRIAIWLLASLVIAAGLGSVLVRVSAQADPARLAYDNDVVFEELSGAARTLLELKFGPKTASRAHLLPEEAFLGESAPVVNLGIGPNVLVNNPAADATAQDTQSETTLVRGGSVVVVGFNDSGSYGSPNFNQFTGWSRSTNGGVTFTDMGRLPASAAGDAGDPVLARDALSGSIYFVTLMFSGSGLQVFKSIDSGASFSAPVNAAPGTTGFLDKEWMAVDSSAGTGAGYVYVVFREFGGTNSIRITRSIDGGATFGPSGGTLIVSQGSFNVQGAFVTVAPNHDVYVFWYDQSGATPYQIMVRRSTDQGMTFGAPVTITNLISAGVNGSLALSGGFRSNSFPHAAVNPVNGDVYVVYNDCTSAPCGSATDHGNIFFRRSTDNGATWSAATQVNDDGTTRDQFTPTIAVLPDGSRLIVTFYDRRLSGTNTLIDRFGAIGDINPSGGAVTFEPNFRITDTSFPVVIGQDPVINSVYMGDYDQAVADATGFNVTWGDNRSSNAFHAHQPDVRFARFDLTPGCGPHRIHGHISTVPPLHSGTVAHSHHGQHGHTVIPDCPPHAPGHSVLSPDPEEMLLGAASQAAGPTFQPGQKIARRGSVLSFYGSAEGLFVGELEDQPASRFLAPASGSPLYYTTGLPEVRIGGTPARVLFSGLAPGQRGVWQINVVVPPQASPGRQSVMLSYDGEQWATAEVNIQ